MRTALLIALPLFMACGGGRPEAQRPAPDSSAAANAGAARGDAAVALEPSPAVKKLVNAGAAPRKALRYEFKKGATEWLELDMKTSSTMTSADQRPHPSSDLPTARSLLRLNVKDVSASGDAIVAFEVVKVETLKDSLESNADILAILERNYAGLVGLHGTMAVSSLGVSGPTEYVGAPAPDPNKPLLELKKGEPLSSAG